MRIPAPRPLRALALTLAVLFVPAPAGAADAAGDLPALRREQVLVWSIVRDFHMQTLLSGDPARTKVLKEHVASADLVTGKLPMTNDAWTAFRKAALANNIATDGYTDDVLVGDLYASADALSDTLDKTLAAARADKARQVHAVNVLLQKTAAHYLKRAAQMSPDIGAEDDFDIGKATTELDGQIAALDKAVAGNKDATQLLQGVRTKWSFIKGSLLKYNEKTVPYITDRYAQQISDDLTKMAEDLEAAK